MNGLSPAELERLAILSEECGEIIQAVGKILRHGWDSKYDSGRTNREQLEIEIADVAIMFDLLIQNEDVSMPNLEDASHAKILKMNKYLHYNKVDEYCHVDHH